jgi:tRNA nucleotidyltransferase (CCA-adding enzyme)
MRLLVTAVPSALLDRLSGLGAAAPVVAALRASARRGWSGVPCAICCSAWSRATSTSSSRVDAAALAGRAAERLDGAAVVFHERFGTATVRGSGIAFDVAGTRRETYARPGALPEVTLGAALADDLARRDFTVNTLALRVADGRLTGWPGAQEDLAARVLRVLHDASFRDDPTRLVRLARYAGRLGFAAEPRTAALAAEAVGGGALATVSGERLGAELRLLAREPQPAALVELARHGLGEALLPGLPGRLRPRGARRVAQRRGGRDGGRPPRADLAALAATVRGTTGETLTARLRELAFPAGEARRSSRPRRWIRVR